MRKDYSPQKLYNMLSRTVIGQDEYLKKISVIVWLHNKRIEVVENERLMPIPEKLQKHNLLCVGPTGSGKTLALQQLAKLYGLDLLVFDASSLTGAGWKGNGVEDILLQLIMVCEKDVKRAQKAIVVLDEIDKMLLAKSVEEQSFCAENTLLKIIEGDTVEVERKGEGSFNINTENILFIAAGAFEGIENIVRQRLHKKHMGFGGSAEEVPSEQELYQKVSKEDLKAYGMGSQMLGRFSDIAVLKNLGVSELSKILLESDSSVIRGLGNTLRKTCGVSVSITDDGAAAVARQAIAAGTGARGLAQIIIPAINDTLFIMEDEKTINEIQIVEMEDGTPGIKLIEGKRLKKQTSTKHFSFYQNEKLFPYSFPKPKRKNVEHFVNYIMAPGFKNLDVSMREAKAIHALLCSMVFYILAECDESDWNLDSVGKLLKSEDEDRIFKFLVSKVEIEKECQEYYVEYSKLDIHRNIVPLALEIYYIYMKHPYFGQDLIK